ncbi:MAG: cytochrome c peroxidase, partial [Flavobacteriales bacterium]
KLFFDPILSLDKTISCGSCHRPENAFADVTSLSLGVNDSVGTRNTPSVMNMASRSHYFYDGRAATLEEQAIGPIENPVEMNLKIEEATLRLNESTVYFSLFKKIYFEEPTNENLANALAEFQRTLESDGSAPHDKWMNDEDPMAMTLSQKRGRELFLEKAKCFDCHFGPDFTGDEFRNIGLYDEQEYGDKGRFDETKDSNDLGKFKVPGLRNVALTAPYMHDGSMETLEEVIEYYSDPYMFVENPINMDSIMIKPLKLTVQEKADLVNFLHSLTDETRYAKR